LLLAACQNEQVLQTGDEAEKAIWGKIAAAYDKWASGDPMGFTECAAPWKVTSVYRYADGDWLSVHEN
jgi:hypothetical protein